MRHLSPLTFVAVVAAVVAGCADRSLPPAGEVGRLLAEVAALRSEVADLRGVILGTIASSTPAGEVGRLLAEVADLRGAVEQLRAAPGGPGKRLHWVAAGVDVGPAAPGVGPAAWIEALGGPGDILSAAAMTFTATDCTGEPALDCAMQPGHVARLSPTGGGWIRPGRPVHGGGIVGSRLTWDSESGAPLCATVGAAYPWGGCTVEPLHVAGRPVRREDLRLEWW